MNKASDILFNKLFDNKPLFKNQIELVTALLNTKGSFYYIDPKSPQENISKAVGRLKTYISQLLSDSVSRNITEDLRKSLELILKNRLKQEEREIVLQDLFQAIQEKNASLPVPADNAPLLRNKNMLSEEIENANYICVMTARPIDMDAKDTGEGFSIRNAFFRDLIVTLTREVDKAKFYRFNFPSATYCQLFWAGLEKILFKALQQMDYEEVMDLIYTKNFSITTETISEYKTYNKQKKEGAPAEQIIQIGNTLRKKMVQEILERLNRNKIIMVFAIEEPIFTLPLIVINPNESTAKVYALLDFEEKINLPYKFSPENVLIWRIFVWDKIRADNRGNAVPFNKS